jgi:hypothetical protein
VPAVVDRRGGANRALEGHHPVVPPVDEEDLSDDRFRRRGVPVEWQASTIYDCPNPPKGRPCPAIAGNRANIG